LGKALAEFKKASNEFKNQLEVEMMNIELEESAKKQQAVSPKILPAEKVFDTLSAPPSESIPRGLQPSAADTASSDLGDSEAVTAIPTEIQAVSPEVPSHNV